MEPKNRRSLGGLALSAAVLMLSLASKARADGPATAVTPDQVRFETFYGSTTAGGGASTPSFYSFFSAPDRPELQVLANYLADQLEPQSGSRQTELRARILDRFRGLAGEYRNNVRNCSEQYVAAALLYGLGRAPGNAAPPLSYLPERTDAERAAFRQRILEFYTHYLNTFYPAGNPDRAYYDARAPLYSTGFFTELARDIRDTNAFEPGDHRFIAVISQRDGNPAPLALLAPFASGRPFSAAANPFAPARPVPPPPPVPVLSTSPQGRPVLNFSRIGQPGSGFAWQTVTLADGRTQRVLTQQLDGAAVEVGRVWSQGGFTYLNYTGQGGNPSHYGQLYALGRNGALPAGQVSALPPGIDYSRVRAQTVQDVTGGTRQVVLLPRGDGTYQDLAGNSFTTTTSQQAVYYACGFRGRRTCMGYQETQAIRPVDNGGAPPARLPLAAASAAPTLGQYSLVTQPQPNEWGARRILQRNGHPVGYVITVGGQDVIFMGSPNAHRWAIYRMDGTAVTTSFSGQSIISRNYRGRTVALIPTGGNRYVDVAGRQFEVSGNAVRQLL